MKKQKEESRKARQAEKRQRRQLRNDASPLVAGGAADVTSAAESRSEDVKD